MVRSPGCVEAFATRANLDSDHDHCPAGAAVDTLGKRLHAAFLSGRPTGSLRRTPPPRLLHHAPGRRQMNGAKYNYDGNGRDARDDDTLLLYSWTAF
jgi:hypothetical protein